MKKLFLVTIVLIMLSISVQPVFAQEVTSDVTLIEPGLWDTIKQNIGVVVSVFTGTIATVKVLLSTIKTSIKTVGETIANKKAESDANALSLKEKAENTSNALKRLGQLEMRKQSLEGEILSLDLKLDFIENEDSKDKVESRIAELKAELAGVNTELKVINAKFNPIKDITNNL